MIQNIIANYVGKIWGFASIYLFIPLYLKILGVESYAVINLYGVLLGLITFADAGLTATLNREFARDVSNDYRARLLKTFERIYFGLCVITIVIVALMSDLIANLWLKTDNLTNAETSVAIKYIAICLGFQLMTTLYQGGLLGLQRQVLSNTLQIFWSMFRSGLVLIPLYFYPSLKLFLAWQIISTALYLVLLYKYTWKELAPYNGLFQYKLLRNVWRYALGMLLIGSISAINIQADKLVASKLFSLTDFGYYSLASTLAQIPVILTMPIVVAVFPRLASLGSNCTETQELFHRYSFVVTVFSSISAVVLILYTSDWILLWTHNEIVSTKIEVVTKLLLTGSFFLSIQFMPYYLALANGYTRSNIFLGIVSIVLTIPLLYFFINHYGMAGAGVPWVFVNLAAFFVLGYHILNRFLPGNYQKFVIQDVLVPLLVTVTVGIIFYYYMPVLQRYRTLLVILYSLVIAGLSLLLNLLLYNVMNRGREIPFRFWLVFKK